MYAHAEGRTPDEVVESVRRYYDEGYRHVRAQMGGYGGGGMIPPGHGRRPEWGFGGPVFDEEAYVDEIPRLFERIRTKLGDGPKLLHDVHEHLTPAAAVDFTKRMEPFHMFFVEDLLPPEQVDHFRRIRQVTSGPLAMGELFTHPLEWTPLIAERLIDFVRCRQSAIGGITRARKLAAVCEAFGCDGDVRAFRLRESGDEMTYGDPGITTFADAFTYGSDSKTYNDLKAGTDYQLQEGPPLSPWVLKSISCQVGEDGTPISVTSGTEALHPVTALPGGMSKRVTKRSFRTRAFRYQRTSCGAAGEPEARIPQSPCGSCTEAAAARGPGRTPTS